MPGKPVAFIAVLVAMAFAVYAERTDDVATGRSGAVASPMTSNYQLPDNPKARYFFGGLNAAHQAASGWWYENSLSEYMPNQEIVVESRGGYTKQTAVVLGRVTDVAPGRGFYVPGDGALADAASATATSFDDSRSQWKIASVEIAVDQAYGLPDGPDSVRVSGFLTGTNYERQVAGILSLGEVIVVLDLSRAYEWDQDLLYVARGGNLFGDVDGAGAVAFPALADDSADFVGELATTSDIADDASRSKPTILISVDRESGVVERTQLGK